MQTIILSILIAYPAMIFLCEAWLEQVIIDLKNPHISEYNKLNWQEHFRSAVFAVLTMAGPAAAACYFEYYWLVSYILVSRRIFFDIPLKLFRNRDWYRYEGSGPVDNLCKRVFGINGAWKELLLELLLTALSLYLTFKS